MEIKLQNNKQSIGGILFERALKTNIKLLYDKEFIENYDDADELIKKYLVIEKVNERRRLDLEELMMVFHDCIHEYNLKDKATSNKKTMKFSK